MVVEKYKLGMFQEGCRVRWCVSQLGEPGCSSRQLGLQDVSDTGCRGRRTAIEPGLTEIEFWLRPGLTRQAVVDTLQTCSMGGEIEI